MSNQEQIETAPVLTPGTPVICTYRIPPRHNWDIYVGPLWVGVVEEPGTDPEQWNGRNSEAHYCEVCGSTRLLYPFGIMHDSTANLILLTAEQSALAETSGVEKKTLLCSLLPNQK